MSEESGNVAGQSNSTGVSESTAAAAAFASARNDSPPAVEVKVEPVAAPAVEETPPPKLFAGKTEDEIAALLSEIPSMKDGYRKQIDNLAGNYGKLNAALQKLQTDTPRGEAVTVNDEDLKEMQEAFPELANLTKSALNNVLKRLSVQGGAAEVDPALIEKLVGDRVSSAEVAIHKKLLKGFTPDWEAVIGVPDSAGVVPKTAYRDWLATQPAGYQTRINSSVDAFEISSSVKDFQASQEAIKKKQEQNKQRLTNAVQPAGSVAARSAISEQQAADAAFQKSRGR